MHPVIEKTFCGLSRPYYFRHLFFGLAFFALVNFLMFSGGNGFSVFSFIFFLINSFLYPYARFVYESIVGFLVGDNVFFVNAFFMLFVKLVTMTLCWAGAIIIAPVGLAYLYYYHSKKEVS